MLLLTAGDGSGGPGDLAGGGGGGGGGPSAKDKRQAAQLMQSTETLMKFGFMSMSMTYFSSLNMIRAMRSVGATDTVMAALAHNTNGVGLGGASGGGGGGDEGRALALEQNEKLGAEPFRPALKPGQLPGQESLDVAAWSVDDVSRWLQARVAELDKLLRRNRQPTGDARLRCWRSRFVSVSSILRFGAMVRVVVTRKARVLVSLVHCDRFVRRLVDSVRENMRSALHVHL